MGLDETKNFEAVAAEILLVDVAERPCYYEGIDRTKAYYIRIGGSGEPMTDYKVYSYEAFRGKYQNDIRKNEQTDVNIHYRFKKSNPECIVPPGLQYRCGSNAY